jgi:hypothetical protein
VWGRSAATDFKLEIVCATDMIFSGVRLLIRTTAHRHFDKGLTGQATGRHRIIAIAAPQVRNFMAYHLRRAADE